MNKLLLNDHYLLYVGRSFDTVLHSHHAAQVCIGIEQSFLLGDLRGSVDSYRAAVIAANESHRLAAPKTAIATLFLDVQSEPYGVLSAQYMLSPCKPFHALNISKELLTNLNQLHQGELPWQHAKTTIKQIINEISYESNPPTELDSRVNEVLKELNKHTESQIPIERLAAMVHLSPSRLAHLFKAEVGTPIRRYSLWQRIRVAMKHAIKKQSLTEGAHLAGFTDSAHFSRVFKQMFGINPSAIVNRQFPIEVVFD